MCKYISFIHSICIHSHTPLKHIQFEEAKNTHKIKKEQQNKINIMNRPEQNTLNIEKNGYH